MKKKLLFSIIVFSIISIISVVNSFANSGIVNTVENMGKDAGNTVMDSVDKTQNTIQGAGSMVENTINNADTAIMSGTDNLRNDDFMKMTGNNYDAERTSAETYVGMNTNTWVWIVTGIVALATLAFVWYYNRERTTTHTND